MDDPSGGSGTSLISSPWFLVVVLPSFHVPMLIMYGIVWSLRSSYCHICMEPLLIISGIGWSLCSSYYHSWMDCPWFFLYCLLYSCFAHNSTRHNSIQRTSNALRLDLPIEIGTSVSVLFCSLVFFFSVSNKPLPQRPISVCLSARLLVIQLVTLNFDTLHLLLFYSFTGP